MTKLILRTALACGLTLGLATTSFAAGDGLDRNAASQGNSTFAGQHNEARKGSAAAASRMAPPRKSRMMRQRRAM